MSEDKGFQIRDRRSSLYDETPPQIQSETEKKQTPQDTVQAPSEDRLNEPLPPMTFTSFILSLATSGLIQLGYAVNPESGEKSVNLNLARQTIDLLALLAEKTQGNLTSEEEAQMSQVLFNLRMAFVEVEKKR